jgi:hypothetical protein
MMRSLLKTTRAPRTGTRRLVRNVSLLCLSVLLLFSTLTAQDQKPASRGAASKTKIVETPAKVTGVLYKSGNRQDPFLNPMLYKRPRAPEDEELSRGVPPPGIAGTLIAQAILQGIVIRDNGRVAVVRGADTRAYFLKEGDKFFDGYLKTIESDFVTFVQETKYRSGKTLTHDVIKRLRTP